MLLLKYLRFLKFGSLIVVIRRLLVFKPMVGIPVNRLTQRDMLHRFLDPCLQPFPGANQCFMADLDCLSRSSAIYGQKMGTSKGINDLFHTLREFATQDTATRRVFGKNPRVNE